MTGRALRIPLADAEGIALDAQKAIEACDARRDGLRNHLVKLPAEQPHPIAGGEHGIVDLASPVCGVDQLPDIIGARRIRSEAPEPASEVMRAGDHRRGVTTQLSVRPERVRRAEEPRAISEPRRSNASVKSQNCWKLVWGAALLEGLTTTTAGCRRRQQGASRDASRRPTGWRSW
jgi:hypothetical protein